MHNNPNISNQTNGARSIFAKIMSTENIHVVFNPKSKDAWFDTKTRVLSMPNWTGMTPEVYDLLLSHEVSHALHTPSVDWIGLTDELVGADADEASKGVARQYMNIIEDARIERLIKARYPGLARDYMKGYDWLLKNGYMGDVNKYDFSTLPLIDKINIHFKVGKHCGVSVPFSPEEQQIVDMIDDADSFDAVKKITRLVWDQESSNNKDKQKSKNKTNATGQGGGEGNGSGNTEDGDASADNNKNGRSYIAPRSKTADLNQKFFDKHRDKYASEDVFGYLPEYDLSKIIVPHKTIYGQLKEAQTSCTKCAGQITILRGEFAEFVSDANATVDAMVKTFLTKKAAAAHHRQQESKTGTLDMNKLSTYKWNDDLFKHFTIKPNGKNHGFILYLDWSGSMGGVITDVVKQMYILTSFFRRINVPFDVYAFSSHAPSDKYYSDYDAYWKSVAKQHDENKRDHQINAGKENVYYGRKFWLYNLASHTMKKNEYTEAMEMLYVLIRGMTNHNWDTNYSEIPYPQWLSLGDTPLDDALVAANQIVPQFINKYNVEIMNLVVITDGASNSGPLDQGVATSQAKGWPGGAGMYTTRGTRVVNPKNGASYTLYDRAPTNLLAQYVGDNTGCNTMLLFLSDNLQGVNVAIPGHAICLPDGSMMNALDRRNRTSEEVSKFNDHWSKENYLLAVSDDDGWRNSRWGNKRDHKDKHKAPPSFHSVFAIRIPRKVTEDAFEELDMNNTTYSRLKNQFVKSLSRKIVSRSLVNRMVEAMARHT